MKGFKLIALAAFAGCAMMAAAPRAAAQIGVEIGVAPECPYGYYDAASYDCAPYGYYGPEWFTDGIFIGAGPWFHGSDNFRGHVNQSFSSRTRLYRTKTATWGESGAFKAPR
jgi:hypothetical protein